MTDTEVLAVIADAMEPNGSDFDDEALIDVLVEAVQFAFAELAPFYKSEKQETLDVVISLLGHALLRYKEHRPVTH